jgi:hypothetical protein
VSWFFSPIFTAIAAAFFFFCIRFLVGGWARRGGRGQCHLDAVHWQYVISQCLHGWGLTAKCMLSTSDHLQSALAGQHGPPAAWS